MGETQTGRGDPNMSPALRRAIAADTIGCLVDNAVLSEADTAVLRGILTSRLEPGFAVNRKRALGALARSDASADAAEILGRVAADRRMGVRDRAAAIAFLGFLPPELAEKPLLAVLPATSGLLRLAVIKALGQLGSTETLKTLETLDDEDQATRRQLALSRLTVGYRQSAAEQPTGLMEALELGWSTTEARIMAGPALRDVQATIGDSTYGIALNPDTGFEFQCGRTRNVIVLNAALKRGNFRAALSGRGMIASLLLAQAEDLKYHTVRWLLLTSPGRDSLTMAMVRPNGEAALVGEAVAAGEGLRFRLRDTSLERTPTEVDGMITDDEIRWTMRVWRGPLRVKRHPRPTG